MAGDMARSTPASPSVSDDAARIRQETEAATEQRALEDSIVSF